MNVRRTGFDDAFDFVSERYRLVSTEGGPRTADGRDAGRTAGVGAHQAVIGAQVLWTRSPREPRDGVAGRRESVPADN